MEEQFNLVLEYVSKHKKLDRVNYRVVCKLHAEIFNHKYYEPCTCNPKIVNQWLLELKKHFENN